ncbi:MAG: protein-L-isoaspartate O-methyltransferase [Halobacteriaceae archaeon]
MSDFAAARDRLVDRLAERLDLDGRTREAMRAVPRHEFVPERRRDEAYADRPLPIGADQTISAPHMVAKMVDLLGLDDGATVLEVGTGCGYHAAVTAEAVGADGVCSVEYERSLARRARGRLSDLGYGGVSIRVADGREGWPECAPFDACYLTCAAPDFPVPLVDQVRDGGRLLAPIGTREQELVLARVDDGDLRRERHGAVRFVRMRGD